MFCPVKTPSSQQEVDITEQLYRLNIHPKEGGRYDIYLTETEVRASFGIKSDQEITQKLLNGYVDKSVTLSVSVDP